MGIEETVKRVRRDSWRGHQAKENEIKRALYGVLHDIDEVKRIFPVIKAQSEY
jgi:type I restriction enzyme R subunit